MGVPEAGTDGRVLEAALLDSALLRALSPASRQAVASTLEHSSYRRGQTVWAVGDRAQALYILLSGKVKVSRRRAVGRDDMLVLVGPSDMFGEIAVFDPMPRATTASVLVDAHVARLTSSALRQLVIQRPDVGEELLRVLARRLRRTDDDMAAQVSHDVSGRVARTLLDLAERFGTRVPEGVRVQHDLTQVELARLVGASRESVNRRLSAFASRGWIRVESGAVTLIDVESLARRAR